MTTHQNKEGLEAAHRAYERYGQVGDLRAQRLSDGCMYEVISAYLAADPLISSLREENERLRKERDHWQANHDQMVQRNAVLRERPDLPVDRLPAIVRYEERIAALMNERTNLIVTKREQLERLTAERDASQAQLKIYREALDRIGWHEQTYAQCSTIARTALSREPYNAS